MARQFPFPAGQPVSQTKGEYWFIGELDLV